MIHLGDFSFYNAEKTKAIFNRLSGRKHLIMGNHDRSHSRTWWKNIGFDSVSDYPIILEEKYILSHEPIGDIGSGPFLNIHGHIHLNKISNVRDDKRYFNVSVDVTDFKPVAFELIKGEFQKRFKYCLGMEDKDE